MGNVHQVLGWKEEECIGYFKKIMLGSAALWAETINLFKMNKEIHEWLNR